MTAIDLCCGAGGLSSGLIQVGVEVLLGVDCWKEALLVYRRNSNRPTLWHDLSGSIPQLPEVDAIVGGPPCTDFTHAGMMVEGEAAQATVRFAEVVRAYRPRLVAMENVSRGRRCQAYQEARRILAGAGYGLTEAVLDAAYYGVPQHRHRLLMVGQLGGRDGVLAGRLEAGRSATPLTVREYCGDRLAVECYYRHFRGRPGTGRDRRGGETRAVWSVGEPAPTVTGQWWNRRPRTYRPRPRDATADLSRVRSLTLNEASMIQTMDGWDWAGVKVRDAWKMLGNAVPCRLAEHLGRVLLAV